jgi:hypothetical protein
MNKQNSNTEFYLALIACLIFPPLFFIWGGLIVIAALEDWSRIKRRRQ